MKISDTNQTLFLFFFLAGTQQTTLTVFGATRRCRSGISQGNIASYPNAVSGETFYNCCFSL